MKTLAEEFLVGGRISAKRKIERRPLLDSLLSQTESLDDNTAIYCAYHGIKCARCPTCGARLKIKNFKLGFFNKWCSKRCMFGDEEFIGKLRGNIKNARSPEANKKRVNTNLERYGVENVFQSPVIKDRIIETNLERYGVENIANSQHFQTKSRETFTRNYGVNNPAKSPLVQEKKRRTCIERYGVDCIFRRQDFRLKGIKTCIERYGAPFYQQTSVYQKQRSDIDAKRRRTNQERYGVDEYFLSEDYRKRMSESPTNISRSHSFLSEYIRQFNFVVEDNKRGLISGAEVDIWMPNHKIGIEVNGIYWHSSYDKESDAIWRDYHLNKTTLMKQSDYRLIHLTDVEINTKPEICLSMIASVIGKTEKIAARKCNIISVDSSVARGWFNETHIQGWAPCSIYYGLVYNGELVSVMGFTKSRFDHSYDWELVRFSSQLNTTVVGGFSKLLIHFRKHHSGSIVSYADYSRSNGDVYRKNGFEEVGLSKPSYRWVKGNRIFNRHSFMRRNLPNILENFDPNLTEVENCWNHGYRRLWDCGQLKFVLC